MDRLRRRQDFLAAAKGHSIAMPGLVLQGRDRRDGDAPRLGFTCSKKIGNAVMRNRAKRRLREVARLGLAIEARAGYDYVIVGRQAAITREFADLQKDLTTAVQRLHGRAQPEQGTR
jgi:ribonuclease P protein component